MSTTEKRRRDRYVILTVILLLVGIYVCGYFMRRGYGFLVATIDRHCNCYEYGIRGFEHDEMRVAFKPLGWVEARIRGHHVGIESPSETDTYVAIWPSEKQIQTVPLPFRTCGRTIVAG